jgi:hypothetical protein
MTSPDADELTFPAKDPVLEIESVQGYLGTARHLSGIKVEINVT